MIQCPGLVRTMRQEQLVRHHAVDSVVRPANGLSNLCVELALLSRCLDALKHGRYSEGASPHAVGSQCLASMHTTLMINDSFDSGAH